MQLHLSKPAPSVVKQFIDLQSRLPLSYPEVGATTNSLPAGYESDYVHVNLGLGKDVFSRAKAALSRWYGFHVGWVELHPSDAPVEVGRTVAVLARVRVSGH